LWERTDARKPPTDDFEIERGDRESARDRAGDRPAARHDHRDDLCPAKRQGEVDGYGRGDEYTRSVLVAQQYRARRRRAVKDGSPGGERMHGRRHAGKHGRRRAREHRVAGSGGTQTPRHPGRRRHGSPPFTHLKATIAAREPDRRLSARRRQRGAIGYCRRVTTGCPDRGDLGRGARRRGAATPAGVGSHERGHRHRNQPPVKYP
jgi:hypothetical protein